MYSSARQFPHPARRDDTALARASARTQPPPAKLSRDVAPRGGYAPGAAAAPPASWTGMTLARDDELGAILARAVAKRAHGGSGMAHQPGATLQRFPGIGKKKKKKPARPTQALPPAKTVTFGGEEAIPRHKPPTQPMPKPPDAVEERVRHLAGGNFLVPGVVPQAPSPFETRQFDMGSDDVDLFEARRFDMGPPAPEFQPPPHVPPNAPASVAPTNDGFAPDLVPDESGLVPVAGNPYLEALVSRFASDSGVMSPRSYGALRNLQVIATLTGAPKPRPIDPRYLAAVSTAHDWGFAGF